MEKKIILMIILILNITGFMEARMISSRQKRNDRGQIVITERYKDEPDGQNLLIIVKENNKIIEKTYYYSGNKEFKEKQIEIFEDEMPKTVYIYYEKDNPKYWESSIENYYNNEAIATIKYFDNPEKFKEIKNFYDINNQIYKDEILFNREEGKIKEIDYYVNSEVVKVENIYKNDKTYVTKIITYFKSFKDKIKKKEEQYFDSEKEPDALKEIIAYYEEGIEVREEQFFDKPVQGVAYKLEIFYENGKMVKITAYDKDGNVIPD